MTAKIVDALTIVAEITGASLSVPAMKAMAMELAQYPEQSVLKALSKCKRECKYRLTLADVIERIDDAGGFVSADEAWSIACQAMDESVTVVMTDEIASALFVAREVMPDKVGARMAFREVYNRLVKQSDDQGKRPKWFASLGDDKNGRAAPLMLAAQQGRLATDYVQKMLPPASISSTASVALVAGNAHGFKQLKGVGE